LAGTYDLWFRRTYNLAPTDPRYLDATPEQMLTDYWAHHYDDRRLAGKPDEIEDEDESFDEDRVAQLMRDHPEDWIDLLDEDGE